MPEPTAEELRSMAQRLAEAAEQAQHKQLGSADLDAMRPEQVEQARARGQFKDLLSGTDPNPRKDQVEP